MDKGFLEDLKQKQELLRKIDRRTPERQNDQPLEKSFGQKMQYHNLHNQKVT